MGSGGVTVTSDSVAVAFLSKVDLLRSQRGCWLWTGSLNVVSGYPQVRLGGKVQGAHRAAYSMFVGPIPAGLELDHLCKTPPCVNPAHLEPVTRQENIARSSHPTGVALRTGHCIRGHEFNETNTRVRRNGTRVCIPCARERLRAYRAKATPA
jgi:HNH endonuclease